MGGVAVLTMTMASPLNKDLYVNTDNGQSTRSESVEPNEEIAISTSPTKPLATAANTSTTGISDSPQKTMKKKALTATEKAEARALKEAEAQRKAEEKARREEAKRQKEEEKRQREEEKRQREEGKRQKQDESRREKEEKQKAKDVAKAEKEAEKKAKDAAKDAVKAEKEAEKKAREDAQAKKDKSQLRLGAFFKKPGTENMPSGASSRRSSVASIEVDAIPFTNAGTVEGLQAQISDYEKTFPPFFIHTHTELAPITRHPINEARALWAMNQIQQGKLQPNQRPVTLLGKRKRSSYMPPPTVKKLLLEMQGTNAANPIDLETSKSDAAANILKTIPIKVLKFKEDIRPPWIGTYSKAPPGRKFAALCRNPFRRELPNVNYDYDSEAEWEEPEEGEDLNSEGEEEEEDDEDDMGEFLDDEAAEALPKRKQPMGDLEPVYTELNWEGPTTKTGATPFGTSTINLQTYRLATLLDHPLTLPIDPFSTSYWISPSTKPAPKPSQTTLPPGTRIPLNTLSTLNQTLLTTTTPINTKPAKPSVLAKPLPSELMSDFKKAVSGSNLSKIGLIEVLKKDFPQITKKTVEQTLLMIAKRVGKSEREKVWVVHGDE